MPFNPESSDFRDSECSWLSNMLGLMIIRYHDQTRLLYAGSTFVTLSIVYEIHKLFQDNLMLKTRLCSDGT